MLGPPPLVTMGLRQETLNLVLLFQSLWDILNSTTMNQMAVNLEDNRGSDNNLLVFLKRSHSENASDPMNHQHF